MRAGNESGATRRVCENRAIASGSRPRASGPSLQPLEVTRKIEMPKPLEATKLRIQVSESIGEVSALLVFPRGARSLAVLAHGAGAGMSHPFMESVASELAARRIATLRYQFPYAEGAKRPPNARPVLLATVRAAVAEGVRRSRGRMVVAGGKSMGGRMTSLAAADPEGLPGVGGLFFFGFPLHAPKKSGTERAEHLDKFGLPLLFLQGTRDPLAPLDEIEPVVAKLGRRATLHVIDGADHSFAVLKRSGRTDFEALSEAVDAFAKWIDGLDSSGPQRQ